MFKQKLGKNWQLTCVGKYAYKVGAPNVSCRAISVGASAKSASTAARKGRRPILSLSRPKSGACRTSPSSESQMVNALVAKAWLFIKSADTVTTQI